ncbi:Putative ribonuclease H protein At1g65750 [Linum perenne]
MLWVRVLKGLYFPNAEFLAAAKHHRPSWIWTSVLKGREVLVKGIRKNIGNGHTTFLDEAWIPDSVDFKCDFDKEANCRISECILLPQRCWNLTKLRSLFSEETVKQICTIPLGPEELEDRWVWHFEPKGNFTVRSCYKVLNRGRLQGTNAQIEQSSKMWKWLWGLSLPRNLRFFLWRLCSGAIATKVNLSRRHCGSTENCVCCGHERETTEHLFLLCPVLQGLWQRIIPNMQLPGGDVIWLEWFEAIRSSSMNTVAVNICYVF